MERQTNRFAQRRQIAFVYGTPPSGTLLSRLWIVFGGNAETALDWLERLKECRLDAGGFLLVDYPGYGVCLGNPSADSILENAIGAYHACIESKRWIIRRPRLGVLGRSIGAAVVYSARNQTYGFGFEGPPDRSTKPSPVRYAPRGYRVSHRSIHIRDRYDRPG